jgi:hypothetical protein
MAATTTYTEILIGGLFCRLDGPEGLPITFYFLLSGLDFWSIHVSVAAKSPNFQDR